DHAQRVARQAFDLTSRHTDRFGRGCHIEPIAESKREDELVPPAQRADRGREGSPGVLRAEPSLRVPLPRGKRNRFRDIENDRIHWIDLETRPPPRLPRQEAPPLARGEGLLDASDALDQLHPRQTDSMAGLESPDEIVEGAILLESVDE